MTKFALRAAVALSACMLLQGCLVVGVTKAAVGVTGAVVGTTVKTTGTVVGAVIPGGGDKKD